MYHMYHRGNSDIHLHPNGKFLYAGIRSPDPGLIAVFKLDTPAYGGAAGPPSLTLVQHEPTQVGFSPSFSASFNRNYLFELTKVLIFLHFIRKFPLIYLTKWSLYYKMH